MTKKNANTNTNWAAKPYAKARGDIARLLDVLDGELQRQDEIAKTTPAHAVGGIEKVRSDLINTVAFIAGMEREEVERFLDEAE
jgi:hypothetical protein